MKVKKGGTKEKANNGLVKLCSKNEFEQFVSFHRRLTQLRKELESLQTKNPCKKSDLSCKQIELDEEVTKLWSQIRRLGRKVGIDLPAKLDTVRAIIYDKEVEEETGWEWQVGFPVWVDGKMMDEIEFVNHLEKEHEAAMKPRYDLIRDLDIIMVRLSLHFDQSFFSRVGDTKEVTQSDENSATKIPSERKSKPLSLKIMATYWGRDMTVKKLRSMIDSGHLKVEKINRQTFIFDTKDLPQYVINKVSE